jgi:hypothetical protein
MSISSAKRLLLLSGETPLVYLLRDLFTTPDAAPITSPRTCEPGPGLMKITDTGDKFSISGGNLVGAEGAAWGDPGHWLGRDNAGSPATHTLLPGYVAFIAFTPSATNKLARFGFDNTDEGNLPAPYFLINAAELHVNQLDATSPQVGIITTSQTKLLMIQRSEAAGNHFVQDGKLVWVNVGPTLAAGYVAFTPYNQTFAEAETALLSLPANGYDAWDADFSTVTDSESAPANATAFDCPVDFHIRIVATHETGKYINTYTRFTDATHYGLRIEFQTDDDFVLNYRAGGSAQALHRSAGFFTDGVEYQIDVVVKGTVCKAYIDNVLITTETLVNELTTASARVDHTLASNDIVLSTHPLPALGIATDRILAPQDEDTWSHTADFLMYFRNFENAGVKSVFEYSIETPGASNAAGYRIRFDTAGEVDVFRIDAGPAYTNIGSAGGGTLSTGDDVAVIKVGSSQKVFVNGTEVLDITDANYSGTVGEFAEKNAGGGLDSIEIYPSDVSALLPIQMV